jgi:hypothetical protein
MNATGKESRHFEKDELEKLAIETDAPGFPAWVSRGLREQAQDSAE